MTGGHAAIDRTACDRTANCPGCGAKKAMADQAVTHHGAGDSADDRSRGR
jgi:hypothetical protein